MSMSMLHWLFFVLLLLADRMRLLVWFVFLPLEGDVDCFCFLLARSRGLLLVGPLCPGAASRLVGVCGGLVPMEGREAFVKGLTVVDGVLLGLGGWLSWLFSMTILVGMSHINQYVTRLHSMCAGDEKREQ